MPRNSSGIYTLPTGNPVIPDTLIDTDWANPTLTDIAQALTDSLDRNGRGNMLAPFKFADGTVSGPAMAFSAEPSTGIYRPDARQIGVSIFGTQRALISDSGLGVTGDIAASGNVTAAGNITGTNATFSGTLGVTGDAVLGTVTTDTLTTDTLSVNGVNAGTLTADTAFIEGPLAAQTLQTDIGTAAAPAWSFAADSDTGIYSPAPGVLAVVTDGVERMRWDATGASNVLPVGAVLDFAGGAAPTGFLLCDGAAVSRATYAQLFGVIGTTWGAGDGSTTFNVPDFRRRVAVGSGGAAGSGLGNTVGSTGGAESKTLTVAEMPTHNHGVSDPTHSHGVNDPTHTHLYSNAGAGQGQPPQANANTNTGGTSSTGGAYTGISINGAATGISIANAGSGNAWSLMQPSAVVTKIIKV